MTKPMMSESSDYRTNNYTVETTAPNRHLVISCRGSVRCVMSTREAAEEAAKRFSTQDRCESANY